MIVNQDVRQVFKVRSEIIHMIRMYLHEQQFMEVETPVLQSIYGGAAAQPFKTFHNELDQHLYLRISLELYLKRLIVGGYERVFEIGRVFRNEGVSFKHNPEYTLLELYQAYADYHDMMALTENLLSSIVLKLNGSYELMYQDTLINFKPPFKRIKMEDAIKEYANVDIREGKDVLYKKAKSLDLDVPEEAHKGALINLIYDKMVEPHLIQPTFIIDYPWETSPLAKKKENDPLFVERFELIIKNMEVVNAFSELNNPIEQYARFKDQQDAKKAGYEDAHEMDEDYINALTYGMPPTGGIGIGIDRIVMILSNMASIRDVIPFPHMKDKD